MRNLLCSRFHADTNDPYTDRGINSYRFSPANPQTSTHAPYTHRALHTQSRAGGVIWRRHSLVMALQMLDEEVHVACEQQNELAQRLLERVVLVHQLMRDGYSNSAGQVRNIT